MSEAEEFAKRLRLQLRARYPAAEFDLDPQRFALRLRAPGVDIPLPLAALHHACQRQPARTPALIADFVRSIEGQLAPRSDTSLSLRRVLWCVRGRRYLTRLGRSDELITTDIAADLVGFVAESLPGAVMRGVPRGEAAAAGIDEPALRTAADAATAERFAPLLQRIAGIARIPADGWRLAGDPLYQGSILMVPAVLRAFVERAGEDVLVGVPDRALALVVPVSSPGADRFGQRVLREWREAMNPCSRAVLRADGSTVAVVERPRRVAALMPWLSE